MTTRAELYAEQRALTERIDALRTEIWDGPSDRLMERIEAELLPLQRRRRRVAHAIWIAEHGGRLAG